MTIAIDVAVVVALILIEALFVAAEISLVSMRDSQVKGLEQKGRRGAAVVRLTADPNRFLSAVQIGVTLTSLLSSAYGAVTLSHAASDGLVDLGLARTGADILGFLLVTIAISFVTLVVGELAPKRIGLQRAEGTAQAIAPTLDRFAHLMRPVIWLLSISTNGIVRLLGADPSASRESMSEEELRGLVASHESLGTDERELIEDVFTAGDRRLREVLVPRTEVDFLEGSTTVAQAWQAVRSGMHSRYPVVRGSSDDIVGFVHMRDLLLVQAEGDARTTKVADLARPVKMMPDGKHVLVALSEMRRERQHMAIVVDEYGGTAGIVTMEDLIEELIGDIRDEYDAETGGPRRLRGGDMDVDGLMNTDDFAEETGLGLPEGPYETVAGFVMAQLGHLPQLGESVDVDDHRLTVSELDGRRVARVRLSRRPGAPAPTPEPGTTEPGALEPGATDPPGAAAPGRADGLRE